MRISVPVQNTLTVGVVCGPGNIG